MVAPTSRHRSRLSMFELAGTGIERYYEPLMRIYKGWRTVLAAVQDATTVCALVLVRKHIFGNAVHCDLK